MSKKAADLWDRLDQKGFANPVEGGADSDVWFEHLFLRKRLWEEAMVLGNTGFVLT